MASPFAALRRRLTVAGGRAAAGVDIVSRAVDRPAALSARIVEAPLAHHAVGEPLRWDDDVAFLDGTQHIELVGYIGVDPVIAAVVRAAVRIRRDRRTSVSTEAVRRVVVGRPHALAALAAIVGRYEAVPINADDPPHPVHDLELGHAIVDRTRAALEMRVASMFRAGHDCWLIVDGTLALSPEWTADPRMIGVVKTHGSLPFAGAELEVYLTLPANQRTSVFAVTGRSGSMIHAWGLRLWPWDGHDLFHGLVRVEIASSDASLASVDQLSRLLLAERAPVTSDPRGDRLLYGIHDVGRYLRAREA